MFGFSEKALLKGDFRFQKAFPKNCEKQFGFYNKKYRIVLISKSQYSHFSSQTLEERNQTNHKILTETFVKITSQTPSENFFVWPGVNMKGSSLKSVFT